MHLGCMTTLATGSNVEDVSAGADSMPSPARASKPTIKGTTIVMFSSSRRLPQLVLERQLPNSLAGGGEDRVGQRGPGDRGARLADSSRRFEIAHQVHFDLRRLVDPQHANVVEV